MTIHVLGPLLVKGDRASALAPRDRVVLGALVVRLGQEVPLDTLTDALWGDLPPASAAKVVQGCVVRLRRVLGAELILTGQAGYRLVVAAHAVDAQRFEALLDQGVEQLAVGEPDRAAYTVQQALALWRGAPLPELEDWEPGRLEAQRLTDLRLQAEELLVEALISTGQHHQVLAEARARVGEEPLRERRWQLLARAQYQSGLQADALTTLRRAREHLIDELGLDPSPELVALETAILRQDPALEMGAAPVPPGEPPYPGLMSFDVGDAATFFGREQEVQNCLRTWSAHGLVTVVGPSGSGKSSLVRAGVAAQVAARGHRVVVMTPGSRPLRALRAAVDGAASAKDVVLVVDQAEELVTACVDEDERQSFVTALVDLAPRVRPVFALSADRLGELAAYPQLVRLIEPGIYLLTRLDSAALRDVIERPARLTGLLLEPGLVDVLVRDVEEQPGALPMLAHALRQTWERREGRTLTVAGYEASGGIQGAVAQSAEDVYHDLTAAQQTDLRDLLLRLVSPSPDREPALNRVPHDVVAPDDRRRAIVERLVRARLLTRDQGTVEIAHASLVRAWPRLRRWLADDLQGQLLWHHLADSTLSWDSSGRPDDELYRGTRLAAATEWERRARPSLTQAERDFLTASRQLHERDARRAQDEATRQRRSVRRLRVLVAAVAAVALVATLLGVSASRQADRADGEALRARSHELAASSLQVLGDDPGLARALAVASAADVTTAPSLQTSGALHRALAEDRVVARLTFPHDVGRLTAHIHPDGDRVAMTSEWPGRGARAVDVQWVGTGEHHTINLPGDAEASSAIFDRARYSPGGEQLLAGVLWHPSHPGRIGPEMDERAEPPAGLAGVHVYDAESHELLQVIDVGPCGGGLLDATDTHLSVYVPDGPGCTWGIAVPRTLLLVDRGSAEVTELARGVTNLVGAAVLSADGGVVAHEYRVPREDPDDTEDAGASGAPERREIVVRDLLRGTEVGRWEGDVLRAVSPDGQFVLQGLGGWEVRDLDDPDAGPVRFGGESGVGTYADFAADGQTVLTVGSNGEVNRWDHRTGQRVANHPGLREGELSVARDGRVAVADASGVGVAVVDLDRGAEGPRLRTCEVDTSRLASVERTGSQMLVASPCQSGPHQTLVVELAEGEVRAVAQHEGHGWAPAPDGGRWFRSVEQGAGLADALEVVGAGSVETVRLQGVCYRYVEGGASPQEAGCAVLPEQPFFFDPCDVAWSPDGDLLAAKACPFHPGLAVWDTRSGDLVHAVAHLHQEIEDAPVDVAFTPDGSELVVTTDGGRVVVLSVEDWSVVRQGVPAVAGGWWLTVAGFTAAGDILAVSEIHAPDGSSDSALHRIDGQTFETLASRLSLHEGAVLDAAYWPATDRVATASAQGVVRVWDSSLDLVHEVPVGPAVPALTWLDQERLAVLSQDGALSVVTTDPQQLLSLGRSDLSRPLTTAECRRFGFPDPGCPTLAVLAAWAAPPDDLDGTYRLVRDAASLTADMVASFESEHGATPDAASQEELTFIGADVLRDRTGLELTLQDSVFEIRPLGQAPTQIQEPEPFCEGSYQTSGDTLNLTAERGSWCLPGLYLEATYELTDDGLHLDLEGFRGPYWERYLWADQMLTRTG